MCAHTEAIVLNKWEKSGLFKSLDCDQALPAHAQQEAVNKRVHTQRRQLKKYEKSGLFWTVIRLYLHVQQEVNECAHAGAIV
jgi:hypothetical protein